MLQAMLTRTIIAAAIALLAFGCEFTTVDDDSPLDSPEDPEGEPEGAGADAEVLPSDPSPDNDPEPGKLKGITRAHNQVRAMTGAPTPPPALVWDPEIAKVAQAYAEVLSEDCAFEHSASGYGENLARFGTTDPSGPDAVGADAVTNWASELDCYTFGPFQRGDQCTQACDTSGGCGHYTQIVWRDTRKLGCGVATCNDGRFTHDTYVCNYDPPGNFIGREPY
jgi:hypothetical protein